MVLDRRLKRGKELAARLPERRGESSVARPKGPLVWMHGASVGEMLSILPLIERIRARDITVLVTAGTVTAAELAERRLPPGVIHQFVPLDVPQFVARFLDHWRPNLGAVRRIRSVAEPDHGGRRARHSADPGQRPRVGALVPALAVSCRARSAPCSAASISASRNPPRMPRATPASARRATSRPATSSSTCRRRRPIRPSCWQLQAAIGTRPVIAAASTHPGEEIELVDVHRRLKHSFPGLLTILVPRHPGAGRGHRRHCQRRRADVRAALARRAARRATPKSTSPTRSASLAWSIGSRRSCSSAARWSATAGRIRSRPPSSAPPSCTVRMSGISPRSIRRSTPPAAPSWSPTAAS